MLPNTVSAKEDFKIHLLNAWRSKLPLLLSPYHPQVLIREDYSSRIELAFLLSDNADAPPVPLRFRHDGKRMELSRDDLRVESGEWKRVPDIASARAEMDAFLADFDYAR